MPQMHAARRHTVGHRPSHYSNRVAPADYSNRVVPADKPVRLTIGHAPVPPPPTGIPFSYTLSNPPSPAAKPAAIDDWTAFEMSSMYYYVI